MVEYFISLMVSGAFLAKLTSALGLSDSLTGILSSFVSLGCTFQLVAILLASKKPVKRWVTALHIVNQLFFALVYFVPFVHISRTLKTVIFIVILLSGHAINNVVFSPKLNWYMSLVDDKKRGVFTANKEIVSLLGGILFSLAMGAVIDEFDAVGNQSGALIFCGLGVFGLMLIHTLTLLFSKEKQDLPMQNDNHLSKPIIFPKGKNLFKLILFSCLWYVALYTTTPFYGTYQIKELGFSILFVSILTSAGSICRAIFSRPMGKFADKFSFVKLINVCFVIELVALIVAVFVVPSNGRITFAIYLILHYVAMAGINSSEINLIYDYVEKDKRVGALALKKAIAGTVGFLTTLGMSALVEKIQSNGNSLFGISVYAQQVTAFISVIIVVIIIVYLNLVLKRMKKPDNKKQSD